MKIYDKLVRDNIPAIMDRDCVKYDIKVVDDNTCLGYLYKKLGEECDELLSDKNIDEVCDCLEVLFAIGLKYGFSEEEVLKKRLDKKNSRGGFEKNIILKKTY